MLKWLRGMLVVVSSLWLSACGLFGVSNVKEAKFDSVLVDNDFSVRQYAPAMLAQVSLVANRYEDVSNTGFRSLFRYIDGNNRQQKKIAMTTPVVSQSAEKIAMTSPVVVTSTGQQRYTMSFFLPRQYTAANAPLPLDSKVKLVARPAMKMAVIRFSGSVTGARISLMTQRLRDWMKPRGYQAVGRPQVALYNPPWTLPPLKRNEVLIPIR